MYVYTHKSFHTCSILHFIMTLIQNWLDVDKKQGELRESHMGETTSSEREKIRPIDIVLLYEVT